MAGNRITFLIAALLLAITINVLSVPRMQVMASRNIPLNMYSYNIMKGNLLIPALNDRACLLPCRENIDCSSGTVCRSCGPNFTCSP
ncbi:hypothetical protein A4A49_11645 [Nicotiana attenuata]|uniref:Carboxypeptidase A inhibitor-like domain-containing protein n=1 Tax=Nicotiana attenuata TaxID=49451 RepID=A0A314KS52_NICAT|nr:hypothetical protein A4A49_11645 [Nicotiana attenuata]